MEKDPIKHSTSHTEIHNPTVASMYFESASMSGYIWMLGTSGQRRLPDGMDLHGYSSSCSAWTVWPKLPLLLKLWAWGCRHCSLDYSEVPTKAGISNPLDYHIPSLSLRCQNMTSGRTRSMREGGGGRIPTRFLHLEARIEAILLMTYC